MARINQAYKQYLPVSSVLLSFLNEGNTPLFSVNR